MWQEIAVIFIGILTAIYIGWKVYKFFSPSANTTNGPCGGCTGCSVKNEINKRKSCCGN